MILKPVCECGHKSYFHQWQWGECSTPGCGCSLYRPKPRRNRKPPAPGESGAAPVPARPRPPEQRPPLVPGPPAQAASDASPPPGPASTARVLRFQADLECGCQITHLMPRSAANSMTTDPCREHGWCALCGWRIGALDGGRYAYVWETCPAHDTKARRP